MKIAGERLHSRNSDLQKIFLKNLDTYFFTRLDLSIPRWSSLLNDMWLLSTRSKSSCKQYNNVSKLAKEPRHVRKKLWRQEHLHPSKSISESSEICLQTIYIYNGKCYWKLNHFECQESLQVVAPGSTSPPLLHQFQHSKILWEQCGVSCRSHHQWLCGGAVSPQL